MQERRAAAHVVAESLVYAQNSDRLGLHEAGNTTFRRVPWAPAVHVTEVTQD